MTTVSTCGKQVFAIGLAVIGVSGLVFGAFPGKNSTLDISPSATKERLKTDLF